MVVHVSKPSHASGYGLEDCGMRLNLGKKKKKKNRENQWLMPVILPTPEAEIRRIVVRSQPRQIVL
jgi:hypothetical protein